MPPPPPNNHSRSMTWRLTIFRSLTARLSMCAWTFRFRLEMACVMDSVEIEAYAFRYRANNRASLTEHYYLSTLHSDLVEANRYTIPNQIFDNMDAAAREKYEWCLVALLCAFVWAWVMCRKCLFSVKSANIVTWKLSGGFGWASDNASICEWLFYDYLHMERFLKKLFTLLYRMKFDSM